MMHLTLLHQDSKRQGVATERNLFDVAVEHPGRILQRMLEKKGWTQDELAAITGKTRQTISLLVSGKSGITPDMAIVLAAAFQNAPNDWLQWDANYRLSCASGNAAADIQQKARFYELAPIRDMEKRGWIPETKSVPELERALKHFFQTESFDEEPTFPVAMRRPERLRYLSPPARAWLFRARQLASAIKVTRAFEHGRLRQLEQKLRVLAAYPKEAAKLPEVFAEYGIRFVVVEPLPNGTMDGAAFWLDENSPVIAVSVRYDRMDIFWFTVMHEFAHVRNGDGLAVDTELIAETAKETPTLLREEQETRANTEAAAALVSPDELDSFIRRVGPLYSKVRIVQFAHRIKIHPSIIIGQLQHRGELSPRTNKEMLPKIRNVITATALTDGWGRTISPGML